MSTTGERVRATRDLLVSLESRVRSAVSHVGLFPLVRLIERALAPSPEGPESMEVGGDGPASRERIHFTHPPQLAFPVGDLEDLVVRGTDDAPQVTLTTTLLGLLGTESPLAPAMSEEVLEGDHMGGLQAFYDVFQHRALSLLYRAWKRYSPSTAAETTGADAFSRALLSLVGNDAFSPYDTTSAVLPMFTLGLSDFSRCEPSYLDVAGLARILQRVYPELAPRVSLSDARFVQAADEDTSRLGVQRSRLGVDTAYGAGAMDAVGRVRIVLGPVDREAYEDLMPGGRRYTAMQPMIDEWLAHRAVAELEVVLAPEDAPRLTLGRAFGAALGVDARYGQDVRYVRVRVPLLSDPTLALRTYHDDV